MGGEASFPLFLKNVLIDGLSGDRGQVATLLLTEFFSISPALFQLTVTPKIAMAIVLLPIILASRCTLDAFAFSLKAFGSDQSD